MEMKAYHLRNDDIVERYYAIYDDMGG